MADMNFIRLALSTGNTSDNYKLEFKLSNQLLSARLDDYDVLFIVGEEITSGFERIKSFVEQGGGLIIFPSSKVNADKFNNLIKYDWITTIRKHNWSTG